MTRVKVCGITNATDRDAAVACGADALGFIVDVPVETPRAVSIETAAALVAGVPPLVTTVLVTMPETPEAAIDLVDRAGVDAVQVHGDLPPGALSAIGLETGAKTIKAVDADDGDRATAYDGVADALLVDSTREGGAGGTGETADWAAARSIRESVSTPVILAGGLTPDNVAEAVGTVGPFGVDVASGIERAGGKKDHDALARFVANATATVEARP